MNLCLFFEPSLLRCFISCFSLRRPHSLFVPCFTGNKRFLTLLFLIFLYQPSFWISSKKMSFCFWTKVSKNIIDTLLIIFKLLFFLSFIILCFLFFHAWSSKTFAIFLCFHILFWKISCFFCRSPFVSVQKKSPRKKNVTLFIFPFFLTFSSSFILSHLCHIFMFTLLAVSLLILHAFSLFFSLPCFSFHVTSPSVCLSLCLFTLSLFYASSVYSFQKITFIYLVFFSIFFICSSLLAKLFLFFLLCCFAPFSHLFFFNRVLSNKRNWPFFPWQKKSYLIPPRIFFLKFCHFMFKKSFIVFRIFEIPLKQSAFCNFVQKTHKMAFATNNVCPDLIFW